MATSLFLAKLFGVYLLVMAGLWAVRGEAISKTVAEFFDSRPMLFLSGLLALAAGLAIVLGHPVWEFNWRGLITLFGCLSIAKGIARIGFPEIPQRATRQILAGAKRWIWIGIMVLLGGYLSWVGFTTS